MKSTIHDISVQFQHQTEAKVQYRVHLAGIHRKNPASDSQNVPHGYFDIVAPRASVAVRASQIAFSNTMAQKQFRGHARGIYPHLHGISALPEKERQ
jgi:hypothetical protein